MRRSLLYSLFLILFLLLPTGFSAWWALKHGGITIDRISLSSVQLDRLSFKLDKRLIVDLDRLAIRTDPGATLSDNTLDRMITWIKRGAPLVQEVRIHRIDYNRFSGSLSYKNNLLRIDDTNLNVVAGIRYRNGTFHIDLADLSFKKYHQVHVTGKATYTRSSDLMDFSGAVRGFGINGTLRLTYQNDTVDAALTTEPFTDLSRLIEPFPLDKKIRSWITQKITAQRYQIDNLHLRFKIKDGVPIIDPENIEGSARAGEADIRFHPDLPPVHCKEIGITLRHDRLAFDLTEPIYENKKLDGSRVYIDHIIQDNSALVINIKTDTRLDPPVSELLKAYDARLPFLQHSGSTRADLQLKMNLSDFTLQIQGKFVTGRGEWSCLGVPFLTYDAAVKLENNHVTLERADVSYQDILRTKLTGAINTSTGIAELQSDIDHLTLRKGHDTVLQAARVSTPVSIDFSGQKTKINLKRFQSVITLDHSSAHVALNSLTAVKPIVPLLQQFDYQDGRAEMVTRDMKHFTFTGIIDIPNTVLSKGDTPITTFDFQADVTPEKTDLSINKGKITATITDIIHVNLTDYLVTLKNSGKTFNPGKKLHISGVDSPLNINGYALPAKQYQLETDGGTTTCTVDLSQGNIQLNQSSDGTINFGGSNLPVDLVEQHITFVKLQGGLFNIFMRGTINNYEGYLDFKDVVIQDNSYVILNNILAFLDAIPALATFSSTGFNRNGYQVKEGFIHFQYRDNVLTILNCRIDGTSINSLARGRFDFNTKTVNMDLTLQTLKSFSNIINIIPWAGYAILGKNGRLSTTLKIEGSLENPDITTHLSEEAVMAPINIIKRTVEWPFKILRKATK